MLSVDSNFFEVGGYSLLVTLVGARFRDAFLIEMSLVTAFEAPTVGARAEVVEALQWVAEANPTPPAHEDEHEEFEL